MNVITPFDVGVLAAVGILSGAMLYAIATIAPCVYCGKRILPWQRRGWRVERGNMIYWHADCYRGQRHDD